MTVSDSPDYTSADVQIRIKTVFPVKSFDVLLGEEPLELTESEKRLYSGTVTENGTLTVSLTNLNGMNKTVYENISCIDDEPPIITEDDAEAGYVSMYIDDTQAGVDFGSVYALDSNGSRLSPALIDEGEGLVVFNYDTPTIEVHVLDKSGRESVAGFGQPEDDPAAEGDPVIENETADAAVQDTQ